MPQTSEIVQSQTHLSRQHLLTAIFSCCLAEPSFHLMVLHWWALSFPGLLTWLSWRCTWGTWHVCTWLPAIILRLEKRPSVKTSPLLETSDLSESLWVLQCSKMASMTSHLGVMVSKTIIYARWCKWWKNMRIHANMMMFPQSDKVQLWLCPGSCHAFKVAMLQWFGACLVFGISLTLGLDPIQSASRLLGLGDAGCSTNGRISEGRGLKQRDSKVEDSTQIFWINEHPLPLATCSLR